MATIKTNEEIEALRAGGRKLAGILAEIVKKAEPGVSTLELDRLAESLIFAAGGKPSFKGYRLKKTAPAYPASVCVSVNDEVVHSIPRKDKILRKGDVVGFDIGMVWPSGGKRAGLYTDMAVTVGIGKISDDAERLLAGARESLFAGIAAVKPGATTGDIGSAVERCLRKYGLGIVRDLAGHGVGYQVHEKPLIPNFGKAGEGEKLKKNMVLALEPMATLGDWRVKLAGDGWTFKTADGSLAAHFEHTVAVTEDGAEILTDGGF